jgi:hypothetical protein
MGGNKTMQSTLEFKHQLNTELNKCAEKLTELESAQLAGDFSIELARKINVLRYHMEVIENRLSGSFESTYRTEFEIEVPKKQ